MVTDYCSGGDLSTIITRYSHLKESEARFFICELILAIEHLHINKVLYRDLKPENILLDKNGHIKLADFGLSKVLESDIKIAGTICGSPLYYSPEIALSQEFNASSDIYGIGLVLFEMVFGEPLFYIEDYDILMTRIINEDVEMPFEVEEATKNLILKLLNKNPNKRPEMNELKSHGKTLDTWKAKILNLHNLKMIQ